VTDLCYRRFRHLFPFLSYLHFDDTTIAIPTTSVSSKRPRLHILLHPVSCPLSSVLRLPRVNDVSPVRSILRQSQEFHALNSELSSPIFNDLHVRCLLVVILALYITRGSFIWTLSLIPRSDLWTQPQLLYTSVHVGCVSRTCSIIYL